MYMDHHAVSLVMHLCPWQIEIPNTNSFKREWKSVEFSQTILFPFFCPRACVVQKNMVWLTKLTVTLVISMCVLWVLASNHLKAWRVMAIHAHGQKFCVDFQSTVTLERWSVIGTVAWMLEHHIKQYGLCIYTHADPYFLIQMPRCLLISGGAQVRHLFEGGVYSRAAFITFTTYRYVLYV